MCALFAQSLTTDHNGSTLLTRADATTDFISPYNAGADGLVIWGDAGGNPESLSCMCDPQHNGPTDPSYFDNIKQQTGTECACPKQNIIIIAERFDLFRGTCGRSLGAELLGQDHHV